MRIRYIVSPNLPQNCVACAVASPEYPQVISALENSGIEVLVTRSCKNVLEGLSCHADMLFLHLGANSFAVENNQHEIKNRLLSLGFQQTGSDVILNKDYPDDISLNSCIVGDFIICNEKFTPSFLFGTRCVINVRQGYAKCSCIPVDENSLITDDKSIYAAATAFGLDALLVEKGSVVLKGFDTGFIGGCCGKLSKDTLAFCGDIRLHPSFVQIDAFLRERNVFPLSLFGGNLIDIGSILPITEKI